MPDNQIFVGRYDELKQFSAFLEDPKGSAAIVVGQSGMGKTWLINKMADLSENLSNLKCWTIRYEITEIDDVNTIATDIMDDAYAAIEYIRKNIGLTKEHQEKWKALFGAAGLIPLVGKKLEAAGNLIQAAFIRDLNVETRSRFLKALGTLSSRLNDKSRLVFFIDPEKYMKDGTDAVWGILIKHLPKKVKFVFAQRSEDVLVDSEVITGLGNVSRIPNDELDVLSDKDVDNLLDKRKKEISYPLPKTRKTLARYNGHPFAVGAALDLLAAGVNLDELPNRPEPVKFAQVQWKQICKRGKEEIRFFKAYAILQVAVPDAVVQSVSQLDADSIDVLIAEKYLEVLIRKEAGGSRIYHAILADYILSQMTEDEKRQYHTRAINFYREKLNSARQNNSASDPLAAARLPEHVLAIEDPKAFVYALINECYPVLRSLGMLDTAESLLLRVLEMVEDNTEEKAAAYGNLGIVYRTRGDLNKAEEMHKKALEIFIQLGSLEGQANQYGNLGGIYSTRGDLNKAEEMHKKALEINIQIGRLEGQANQYGNLGGIYEQIGDKRKAKEYWQKSLGLYKQIGIPNMAEQIQSWLDSLDKK